MNRKKIIISLIIFIVLFFLLFFFFWKKNTPSQQTTNNQPTSNPLLPPSYPITTFNTSTANESPYNITIDNPESSDDVKNAFDSFLNRELKDLDWGKLVDNKNNPVSLDRLSEVKDFNIDFYLKNLLNLYKFDLISCSINNKKYYGIVLNLQLLPNYKGDLYEDEMSYIEEWEKTMLPDTKNILFPKIDFTNEQLQQKLVFKDGKYRYAEVSMPDGSKGSINYNVLDDYIVIASSPTCVEKASNELITPE